MRSLLARIPFRESRGLIVVCAVVFLGLLVVKESVGRPEKAEKRLERLQQKNGTVAPEAYVPVWLYKGLKANLVITGLLLLASPWLGRRRSLGMALTPAPAMPNVTRWEVIACVALMGVAAWHNAPRLFHSMWGDEEFNASRFILDEAERQPDGSINIIPRSWVTTLWNMRKPTNHLGYSAFARLSHDAFFTKSTAPDAPWFSEALLRAPVFIAGLLLIPAFLWALRVWGLRAWWGLPFLLLHPWFTRFGVDGRGYGFIMLGSTVLLGVLGRALQTANWRWWTLFGLGNFFIIWSNLQGLYPIVALNLVAAACLFQMGVRSSAMWLQARRWFVANMITLVLIVGMLAPCWPQFQEFLAKEELKGTLDDRFWRDGLCAWAFGQPWEPWQEPENPLMYAMELSMKSLPWVHVAGMALVLGLVFVGICAMLSREEHRPILLFTLGAPALMLLHMEVGQNRPYDWYFCPFVPGLFLMAGAGASLLVAHRRRAGIVAWCSMAVLVGLYAYITREPRTLLRNHPIEPSRDSVLVYRNITNPRNPDIDRNVMSAGFRMFTEGYDPTLHRFDTVAELQALMQESDRSNRPFYVNVGFLRFLREQPGTKDVCEALENPVLFEHVSVQYGLLPPTTRHVFRYRGKSS